MSLQHVLGAVTCALVISVESSTCSQSAGGEFFPGNIFELRPPHVRTSLPEEAEDNPRSSRSFPFFEAPPAIAPQNEIRLTDQDFLTLVYPAHGGGFHSGGFTLLDRLRIDGRELDLDLFHISLLWVGGAVVPPRETGVFLGRLPAGDYNVTMRKWFLPPEILPGFDPETFEPPPNAIMPMGEVFAIPLTINDPVVVTKSSFRFTVSAVPECDSIVFAMLAVLCVAGFVRSRKPPSCIIGECD